MAHRPSGLYDAERASMKVAITPSGYPEVLLSQETSDLITQAIVESLDAIPKGLAVPCFDGCRWEQGALWVTCTDEKSKEWVLKMVPTLKAKKSLTLQTLEKEALPRLKKLTAVPGTNEGSGVILRRLAC